MEIAYVSSNKLKVELDKQSNSISARLLQKVLNSPSNYLATILVGNNISLSYLWHYNGRNFGSFYYQFCQASFIYFIISNVFINI